MQRRRRPRVQPRNIFAPTERRIVNRARTRTRPTISENAQTTFQRSNRKKAVKPKKHFLTLEPPNSPEIDATQNTELIEDYRELRDRLESFSEYNSDQKEEFLSSRILKLTEESDRLAEQEGLGPSDHWKRDDIAKIRREIEILKVDLSKDQNDGFLQSFQLDGLPGNYIRSLNMLNDVLSKSRTCIHVGNGQIYTVKEGVRIIFCTRKTTNLFIWGNENIIAYVGPNNKKVCLVGKNEIPGPDWIANLVMISGAGWPQQIMDKLEGEGRLSINYQLKEWGGYGITIEEFIRTELTKIKEELIHSIEVCLQFQQIWICTTSRQEAGKLIGKGGQHISKLTNAVREKYGKNWGIHVQSIL